jgi:hypothetical protein
MLQSFAMMSFLRTVAGPIPTSAGSPVPSLSRINSFGIRCGIIAPVVHDGIIFGHIVVR